MKKIELVKLLGVPIARLKLKDISNIIQEPKRLWRRYLFGNMIFLLNVFTKRAAFSRKGST